MKKHSLLQKMIPLFAIVGILPLLIITIISTFSIHSMMNETQINLKDQILNGLTAIRTIKKNQITAFLDQLMKETKLISGDPVILDGFKRINTYLENQIHAKTQTDKEILHSEEYQSILTSIDAKIFKYVDSYEIQDIYLISHQSGLILYTFMRGSDFSDNYATGKLKDSHAAQCWFNGIESINLVDFSPYEPLGDAPTAFISLPIHDNNQTLGVLMLQIPHHAIDKIMKERTGMGETGETYVVGEDLLLRSSCHLHIEDYSISESFRKNLKIQTESAFEGIKGNSGSQIVKNYWGTEVLSAYEPIQIQGVHWVILAEISTEEAFKEIVETRNEMVQLYIIITCIGIGLLLLILLLSIFFSHTIIKPIIQVVLALKGISEGEADLTKRIVVKSKDEIGTLSRFFNLFIEKLRTIMLHIRTNVQENEEIGGLLTKSAQNTNKALLEINDSFELIQNTFLELEHQFMQSFHHMEKISWNIHTVTEKITQQSVAVNQSSSSVSQMISSINQISSVALQYKEATLELFQCTDVGTKKIGELSQILKTLSSSSEAIFGMIHVIDNVAKQTNLLAMNAAIEAAHAGKAGKGFAVVANEIRKLAESTAFNANKISKALKDSVDQIHAVASISEESHQSYSKIKSMVIEISTSLIQMSTHLQEMRNGSTDITHTLHSLISISNQVKDGSSDMQQCTNQIHTIMDDSQSILHKTADSVAETMKKIKVINVEIEEEAKYIRRNLENGTLLKNEIDRFQIDPNDRMIPKIENVDPALRVSDISVLHS